MVDHGIHLTPEAEVKIQDFFQHVEWSQGFSLYFVFTSYPALLELFRERLEKYLKNRTRPLRRSVSTQNPVDFVVEFLEWVRQKEFDPHEAHTPILLEVWDGQGEEWETARRVLLGRINELRDRLRRVCQHPFIFVFPKDFKPEVAKTAPDLWDVRTVFLELDSSMTTDVPVTGQMVDFSKVDSEDGSAWPPELAEALIAEWDRVYAQGGEIPLQVGIRAIRAAIGLGDHKKSLIIAKQMESLAREAVTQKNNDLQSQYDFLTVLTYLAHVFKKNGLLNHAKNQCRESLTLCRTLREQYGDQSWVLEQLAASLFQSGDILFQLNDLEGAKDNFLETLELILILQKANPDDPKWIRDYGLVLQRLGWIHRAKGAWHQAVEVAGENLLLRQQIIKKTGESTQLLRDLSLGHDELGASLIGKGDLEEAETHYQHSLTLSRRLVQDLGESPKVLHDLSISLLNCVFCAQLLGKTEQAMVYCQEGLILSKRLAATFPENEKHQELVTWFTDKKNELLPTPPP
ncbi:MAG: hypothetical protein H7839_17495 [Magnetococcus sp. YQC-5]